MRIEDSTPETGDRDARAETRRELTARGFETILANLRRRRRSDEPADGREATTTSFAYAVLSTPTIDERATSAAIVDRIETAARLTVEDASGPGIATSFRLRTGERVELVVRAHAQGVEIQMVAPPALAATLLRDRATIGARLADRGIRLRSCSVRSACRARTETDSEPLR